MDMRGDVKGDGGGRRDGVVCVRGEKMEVREEGERWGIFSTLEGTVVTLYISQIQCVIDLLIEYIQLSV